MSLIHDALKSMDSSRDSMPAAAPMRVNAPQRRPAWLDAMLAFLIVLGAGILGWFVWQHQVRPAPDLNAVVSASSVVSAQPQPAPSALVPAESLQPTAALPSDTGRNADDASAPAAVAGAGTTSVQRPPIAPEPAVKNTTAPALAPSDARPLPTRIAPAATVIRPVRHRQPVTAAVSAVEAKPSVDETPIELRFTNFVAAMKDGRTSDAETQLAALKERLPAGSPGLLRAQAWFDLRAGRDAAAADSYRAILDRMPGDEESAINLASIQVRQNKTEEARATLDAAFRLQPDSTALRGALAKFTPAVRQ